MKRSAEDEGSSGRGALKRSRAGTQSRVRLAYDVAIPNLVFTLGKPMPGKAIKNIFVAYRDDPDGPATRPYLQTPRMYCPFGIGVLEPKDKSKSDPDFSIGIHLSPTSEAATKFIAWANELDEFILRNARANCSSWLGKSKISDKMLLKLFRPVVRKATTGDYPPLMNFKLPRKNGQFVTKAFDAQKQPIHLQQMSVEELRGYGKHCDVSVLFEIASVWSGAKGFGMTFRARQLMFYPPKKLDDYGFVEDVEDELVLGPYLTGPEHAGDEMDISVDDEGENSDELSGKNEEGTGSDASGEGNADENQDNAEENEDNADENEGTEEFEQNSDEE